jgi:hypothetical protein
MKKRNTGKANGVVKGAPSGFVVSLLVHVAAFMLAGLLVVFNVVQKEEQKFVPPKPVERPKMKLKKPKVKVKKTAKPKSTTRIVTKVQKANMPDIQLPEMSGIGDGLAGGGIGGFEILPDLGDLTVFGGGLTVGTDFIGTFYDLKRSRAGNSTSMGSRKAGGDEFVDFLYTFLKKEMNPRVLSRFFRAPKKLYATTFCMPPDLSLMAPTAFGEPNTLGCLWLAHYTGQLVYPEDITFRFWGAADDVLAVQVEGELVLLSSTWKENGAEILDSLWESSSSDTDKYPFSNQLATVGDWITLKAGEPLDMEVVLSEIPGGNFQAILCVEVQGVDYPKNRFRHGPTLPIFKTTEPSIDLVEAIHGGTFEGDFSVTNGPVFKDFYTKAKSTPDSAVPNEPVTLVDTPEKQQRMRIWTVDGETSLEAEFVLVMGDKVVLKNRKNKQVKIPKKRFCEDDLHYISLVSPPRFTINFKTNRRQQRAPDQPPDTWVRPIQIFGYEFGVDIIQKSSADYPHQLTVEFFAIGDEVDGDNFVLLDRQKDTFILSSDNKRTYSFKGEKVETIKKGILPGTPLHGVDYSGYLVTVSDERGQIIQHSATREFLFENLEALKKVVVGRHFDKNCNWVGPPRFTNRDRPEWM